MRPPALVVLATALSALLGVGAIGLGLRNSEPWFIGAGLAMVALGPALWIGFRPARWAAIVAGLLTLPIGIYGLLGLGVVVQDRMMCDNQLGATASIVATSYPSNFCATTNWFTQFGFGFALIAVGVAGLILIATAAMDGEHFDRPRSLGVAARH